MTGRISRSRIQALFRLLDVPTRLQITSARSGVARTVAPLHCGPLPAGLGRRIERLVEQRHRAGRWSLNGGDVFILPPWLVAARESSARIRASAVRVQVDGSQTPRVTVSGYATRRELNSIIISPRKPTMWRRSRITDTAAAIRRDLERILGAPPVGSAWLAAMASAPVAAEQAAIAVWDEFLAAADVPRGLRVPDFELSLANLLMLLDGPSGGRDREWFANQWPAATAAILRAGKAKEKFRCIDGSRSAAVGVATAAFCCDERSDCEGALALAREIPKYRADLCLARVLAGHGPRVEVHIRAILAAANQKEGGAVLRRMARCSAYAREQMEFAAAAAVQPVFLSGECRMAMGQLLIRMFAGSGFDPGGLVPESVAAVFIAVSTDCLAAFVTKRPHLAADKLETGVMAFAEFLAMKQWRLSPEQFTGFIAGAERHTVFREYDLWPAPAAWRQDDTPFEGAIITPLLSQDAIRAEAEAMKNYLGSGNGFKLKAQLGQLALFSIQIGNARATLAIKPLERQGVIASYDSAQLKGPKNTTPQIPCRIAAQMLIKRLNSRLPLLIPATFSWRREHLLLGNQRRFNASTDVANDRWRRYVKSLPKRFQLMSPIEIARALEDGTQ